MTTGIAQHIGIGWMPNHAEIYQSRYAKAAKDIQGSREQFVVSLTRIRGTCKLYLNSIAGQFVD